MIYDLVIIGGGSAGFSASGTAANKFNKKVCIIEKGPFGGLCILRGCMPSKTLIYSARIAELIKKAKEFGIHVNQNIKVDAKHIVERKNKIIKGFADYRLEAVKKNKNIDLVNGMAQFISKDKIKVGEKIIEGKNFLVSTGSRVFIPDVPGLKEIKYLTSDEALELKKLPKSLIVLGGGPVTLELAYYFHNLEVDVTIIQRSNHVMSDNDEDIADVIEKSFRKNGIKLYTGTSLKKIYEINKIKIVEFEQNNKNIKVKAEEILVGLGRIPDFKNLNLERTGMKLNDKRLPILNEYLQTSIKNIYVAGDASRILEVVNVAVEQGRVIANNIFGKKEKIDYHKFPAAVFTHPEAAWIGVTEKEAKGKNMNVEIAKLPYEDLGKAVCLGETDGFIKMIIDKKSKIILGVAIVGHLASDIIHEAVPLLYNKNTIYDLTKMQHIHPTFGEIYSYLVEDCCNL
ncbi:dihydrolipoyl dehydrogenase [Candidatus Woesearchaeota archaeon]|nr:dihydrolipoyl dehydrogenase [Candidatus Woesearchaeota archaeon]